MRNFLNQWTAAAKRLAGLEQRWPAAVAAALLWFDPANGFATAILWWAGVYGIWNWRRTLAGWKNPVGLCFGLGLVWALLSTGWSFYPAGSVRDLVKSTPMVLAATHRRLRRTGMNWAELPSGWDVDTPADLRRLRQSNYCVTDSSSTPSIERNQSSSAAISASCTAMMPRR